MQEIILIGYFLETVELCERAGFKIVGVVDKNAPTNCDYPYLGNDETFLKSETKITDFSLLIVPDEPKLRESLYFKYKKMGFHFATVVSPAAYVSPSARIDEGCIIQDGCNISTNVNIGKCVRVNFLANVMHDVTIGDFSTVAPNSVILGRCKVKECVYIGANSTILPERVIHNEAIVGAGSVVTNNVDAHSIVVGVPARRIEKI